MAVPFLREFFTGALGFRLGSEAGPRILSGIGSPEGVVTAPVGSMYSRADGSTNTATYRKESGTGNTGWVADSAAVGGGGGATYGTATIDFGAYPGSNEAMVAFTDASVPSGAKVQAFIASDATTADHTANDHKYAALFIHLSAQPDVGVGGNIFARSQEKMQGTFAVRWQWAA